MPSYTLIPGKYPENIQKTTNDNYVAEDGWNIEKRSDKYILCFIDPGHGGQHVEIQVSKRADDYARENKPTWNEIMRFISSGR